MKTIFDWFCALIIVLFTIIYALGFSARRGKFKFTWQAIAILPGFALDFITLLFQKPKPVSPSPRPGEGAIAPEIEEVEERVGGWNGKPLCLGGTYHDEAVEIPEVGGECPVCAAVKQGLEARKKRETKVL